MAYWCNGLKAICERDRKCIGCKAVNGKGGKYITTNAERIRAMSDEELAIMLNRMCPTMQTPQECNKYWRVGCQCCWADWLKQPVEESE